MKPVIIIGAARSGTKLLRSIVASSRMYRSVPFDVNYIWRYGNEDLSHDVLTAQMMTAKTRKFIALRLCKLAGVSPEQGNFVEKSVSNTLRLPFVLRVFPDAKFIFLIRDGRDVTESAYRCWQERPSVGYILQKIRTFPWLTCSKYGCKYVRNVAARVLGLTSSVRTWGPRYEGIDEDLRQLSLWEVCALQWRKSIEHFESSRHLIPVDQLLELRYEDLVTMPKDCAARIANFVNLDGSGQMRRYMADHITQARIGSHLRLSTQELETLDNALGPTLVRWNYPYYGHNKLAA
jgi:hypothetical protein